MLKSLRRLFVYYREHRWLLIGSQLLLLVSTGSTIGMVALNQRLIDDGIGQGDTTVINSTGIWMMSFGVLAGVTMAGTAVVAVFFAQGTAYRLRNQAYRRIQDYSFENFDQFRTGRLLVNLSSDVVNVANAVMFAMLILLQAPFMLVVAVVLAGISTPSLLWLIGVVALVTIVILALVVPRLFRAFTDRQERLDDVNNTIQESLSGIRVVKAFGREQLEIDRFAKRAEAMRQPSFRAAFLVGYLGPLLGTVAQLVVALALGVGSTQVFDGRLEVGQVVAFVQYLTLVITPLTMLAIVFPFLLRGDASAQRIFEVIDAEPTISDRPDAELMPQHQARGQVRFEGVSFAFRRPDGTLDPPVLHDIDLNIEAGERVGILGSTGAGKTALVNLISRFYEPTEGRVLLDGIDVRNYPLQQLRSIVGVALQEALLFQNDVRFNLKFGNPDADDDVMIGAARAADTYGFVTNLPEQWEAPVARRGYNFSGGQRQRLSMARALVAEPRVLVLDDSTSALDAATEARVQEAIPDFASGLTTIYVAQRISAVIDLDKIILLDRGRIVALGTHDELLASSEQYKEIYDSQLGAGLTVGIESEVVR